MIVDEPSVPSILVYTFGKKYLVIPYRSIEHTAHIVANVLPTSPDKFDLWIKNVTPAFIWCYERFRGAGERKVRDQWLRSAGDDQSWEKRYACSCVFEIDLGHGVLLYQHHPVYHLDRTLPTDPIDILLNLTTDEGLFQFTEFFQTTPAGYTFDLSYLKVPQVRDESLALYQGSLSDFKAVTVARDILSAPEHLSTCEATCLHFAAIHAAIYGRYCRSILLKDVALVDNTEDIGWNGREIAYLLAAVALLPLHILGPPSDEIGTPWYKMFSEAKNEFWYLRQHICLTLATHLLDERNAQYHISRTVQSIMTCGTKKIVYGVIFSVFHCIVIRVDRQDVGSFVRTEVLEFLPAPSNQTVSYTPGLELLTRLGCLRADDDVDFLYSILSARWWRHGRPAHHPSGLVTPLPTDYDRWPSRATFYQGPRIPLELLEFVAFEIEDPDTLFEFAIASKATMRAAVSALRFPQVRGALNLAFSKGEYQQYYSGHILDGISCPTSESFYARYFGISIRLSVDLGARLRTCNDCRTDGRFWDLVFDQTMPRASFWYSSTSGCKKPAVPWVGDTNEIEDQDFYPWECRRSGYHPHVEFGFVTLWYCDARDRVREAEDGYDIDAGYEGDDERSESEDNP
ncbi:hypothetical protein EIP86_005718 [Pleurotus ostreatoroseus]|nr:hypothetical protein EIP86_005718 [Pleurotus ostreatoroseus]